MTPHISAPDGAFAKTVLLAGDPLRAKFVADTFLDDAKMVTSVRNMYGYTGTYRGVRISVMGSGMGMPSIGIYSHELFREYGVENILRIGSAGSYSKQLRLMDVVLATEAVSDSTYALIYNGCADKVMHPNAQLNAIIESTAAQMGIECKKGRVHSTDLFYTDEGHESWQQLSERLQADCVEMEAFALFHNANVLGKRAATLLTISDTFWSQQRLTPDERQEAMTQMLRLALESGIRF